MSWFKSIRVNYVRPHFSEEERGLVPESSRSASSLHAEHSAVDGGDTGERYVGSYLSRVLKGKVSPVYTTYVSCELKGTGEITPGS